METPKKHKPGRYFVLDTPVQLCSAGGQQCQHLWKSWANYAQRAGHLPMQETIQTASSSGTSMQGANREPVEVLGL